MIFLVVIIVSSSFMWKSVVHQPSLPCILSRKCKRLPGNIVYNAAFTAQHLIYTRFIYFIKQRKQITSACLTSSNCINAVGYSITLFRMLFILLKEKQKNKTQKQKSTAPGKVITEAVWPGLSGYQAWWRAAEKLFSKQKKCQSPYQNIFLTTTTACVM